MRSKEQRAYELRLSGKSFKEIAAILKYADASGAYQAYQRARDVLSLENLAEWRLLELERLSGLQTAIWDKAMEGHVPTVNALLKIFDIRARLLGLFAPEKLQVQTQSENVSINDAVSEMTEMIEYGVKYCKENGIETDYLRRKAC